ncbi:hypothetical protein PCASD_10654 [Puccinia coronata f. sp. avenae]|nr:hypothetical protein PCASD_10654 [Puccinia coronata f. sp. avenae]
MNLKAFLVGLVWFSTLISHSFGAPVYEATLGLDDWKLTAVRNCPLWSLINEIGNGEHIPARRGNLERPTAHRRTGPTAQFTWFAMLGSHTAQILNTSESPISFILHDQTAGRYVVFRNLPSGSKVKIQFHGQDMNPLTWYLK